jgi:hypothetical protein
MPLSSRRDLLVVISGGVKRVRATLADRPREAETGEKSMKKILRDAAKWLDAGEQIELGVRSRAKYSIEGSVVTRMMYADFVLTNRRLAMLTGFFRRKLTTELRPEHVVAVSAGKAFRAPGVYWSPIARRVLVLTVRKDGKNAKLGIAIAAAELEAWRAKLQAWVDTEGA